MDNQFDTPPHSCAARVSTRDNILNAVLFQIGWFACVTTAAAGRSWIGIASVAVIASWHLYRALDRRSEARLLLAALVIGAAWETLFAATGWVVYVPGASIAGLVPLWLLALWILFATTINYSLAWMKKRIWLAALFGGIGGPLSFMAGERLGAVQFLQAGLALAALAVSWALMMPLLMVVASKRMPGGAVPGKEPA